MSLIQLWKGLLDLVLPARCAGCSAWIAEEKGAICSACRGRLPWLAVDSCRLCQQAPREPAGTRCAACTQGNSPLDGCVAGVAFSGEIESWIWRFKYPGRSLSALDPTVAALIGELSREAIARAPGSLPDLLVPIPLHPRRLRQRGFNPALSIARQVTRLTGVPCSPRCLRRLRDDPSQTGLDRRARRRNVAGTFQRRGHKRLPERIWLVDDVVTTGSTLSEAARVLRAGGARWIVGLCVARTPLAD